MKTITVLFSVILAHCQTVARGVDVCFAKCDYIYRRMRAGGRQMSTHYNMIHVDALLSLKYIYSNLLVRSLLDSARVARVGQHHRPTVFWYMSFLEISVV